MIFLYFILFFTLCFLFPSFRVYKKLKINPFVFKKSESTHDLIGAYMKILVVFIFIASVEASDFLEPNLAPVYENSFIKLFGVILMFISICIVVLAQYQMSESWRIGIDETHKTKLITSGIFNFSRNPIFMGMMLAQFGLTLYKITSLNIGIFVVEFILITVQVRLEEEFLLKEHGENYNIYKNKVRRFF